MPEIGCQLWEFPFDIESRSVPMDQRAGGKSVAHIVEPGTTAMALRDGTEDFSYFGHARARTEHRRGETMPRPGLCRVFQSRLLQGPQDAGLLAHEPFNMRQDRKSTRLNSSHLGISY